MLGVLMRIKAVDIDIPQIKRRLAFGDPMRQCHACATARLNADGVKACGDEYALHFRCRSQNIALIGGEAFGSVEEFADADFLQRRNTLHRVFQDRREVIEIFR